MPDKGEDIDLILEPLPSLTPQFLELVERARAAVADPLRLEPSPRQLHRVEFGRIRGQLDALEDSFPVARGHEPGDGVGDVVDPGPIPHHKDRAFHPVEHMREELRDLWLGHVAGVRA